LENAGVSNFKGTNISAPRLCHAACIKRDQAIREDVLFELKYDPRITSSDIALAVKEGVVTLSGFASSY
jgi:osmotically-inducible protein OsmY